MVFKFIAANPLLAHKIKDLCIELKIEHSVMINDDNEPEFTLPSSEDLIKIGEILNRRTRTDTNPSELAYWMDTMNEFTNIMYDQDGNEVNDTWTSKLGPNDQL